MPASAASAVRDRTDLRDERLARSSRVARSSRRATNCAGHVGDRRPHPVPADVDADHPSGARVQLVQHGGRTLAPAGDARPRGRARLRAASRAPARPWASTAPSRGRSARGTRGPTRRTLSRTVRSLIARRRLGVPPTDVRSTGRCGPSPQRKGNFPNYSGGCYAPPFAGVKTGAPRNCAPRRVIMQTRETPDMSGGVNR